MGIIFKSVVIKGNQLGGIIGFPTANLAVDENFEQSNGVYAAKVEYLGKDYFGIANLGNKPTINGVSPRVLEVNIFDFNMNIYGQEITVELLDKIRDEKKFGSIDELKINIDKDVKQVKEKFKK